MSKENKGKKKKVVVSTTTSAKAKSVVTERAKATKAQTKANSNVEMTFGPETFKWMGIGIALMALGFIFMLGGNNEDPNVWDPNVIYNWRIMYVAPILILAGLSVQIYAIFKK